MSTIIVHGNPLDGLHFTGPFAAEDEAIDAGEATAQGSDWWISTLRPAAAGEPPPESEYLDRIAALMSGPDDWNADTLDAIAEIVRSSGREITDEPATVTCSLCHNPAPSTDAQPWRGSWVGGCCWDERLRSAD